MENLSSIVGQLKKERDRVQQQLVGLNAALAAFAGVYSKAAPAAQEKATSHECQGQGRNSPCSKSPMGKGQGGKDISPTARGGQAATPVLH